MAGTGRRYAPEFNSFKARMVELVRAGRSPDHPVRTMCQLPGLSPSGYYAWRQRSPSRRARESADLTEEIIGIHRRSGGTYGAPRIHAELRARGRNASLNRVARLVRVKGRGGKHSATPKLSG